MWNLIIFLLIILFAIYKYLTRYNNYWKNRNIKFVDRVVKKFMSNKYSLAEVYKKIYDKNPNEKYIGIILSQPAVIIKEVEDIQAVLQGDFQNFYSRGLLSNSSDILADNILLMEEYPRWKLMRNKLSPVFTSKKLKNLFYDMERCAKNFSENEYNIQLLQKNAFKGLSAFTTEIITAAMFGLEAQTKRSTDSPFLSMMENISTNSFSRNLKFTISNVAPFLFKMLHLKFFGDHEKFFVGSVKKVLEFRRNNKDVRNDFIDTCIELQNSGKMSDNITGYEMKLTDELVAAQAFFLFLAGVDTTATTMHFALLELASNPQILMRLHEEIDEVFNKCGDQLTYEAVEKMEYLDMVLNETLRKYPSISILQRRCTNNTVLPAGKLPIEKDTLVIVPILALHRDEKYFPEPDLFDPERFSPANVMNIKKYSYLPFGEGNRICIGVRFARLQMKSGLAWLLRKYTLKEQKYHAKFDNSTFATKDSKAQFELIPRTL